MSCAICEDVAGQSVDKIVFFLNGKRTPLTNVLLCPECGYVWLSPKIDSEELDRHYREQGRIPTETIAYKEQAKFIAKFTKPEMRVLDIGSFDGRLLDLLAKGGASQTNCVEPDTKYSGEGYFRTVEDAVEVAGENSYDLITMGHVFEHVQDPIAVLKACKYLLVPGGALFIEVPNLEEPQVQVVPYWTPFHQSYFTPSTLAYMLEVAGFAVKGVEFTGYRAVRMFARNFTNPEVNQGDVPPVMPSRAGVNTYHVLRTRLLEGLRDRLSWLEHEDIVIFGAGDHTRWLFRFFPDLYKNTSCILDSSPDKIGTTFMGLPVEHPDDCPDEADRIIISSYDTQDEMATIVGKRAMQLYEDVRAYDVWLRKDNA